MKLRAFIYIILACVLWGTSGIFVHYLTPYGFTTMQMMAVRAVISFGSMALYAVFKYRAAFKTDPKRLLLYAMIGLSVFGTGSSYFAAMQMTSISTAVVLMYSAPIYVMIFSVLFLKERLTPLKLISVATMLVGCCLVSGIIGGMKFNLLGIAMGALSGVAYAAYNIFTKISMQNKNDPISSTMYGFMFMLFFSLFLSEPHKIVANASQAPATVIPLLIGLGVVTVVVPYFLYTLSMRELPAGTASALGIMEPMAATLFSVFLFGEKLSMPSVCGILLILSAVFLLAKAENQKAPKRKE